MIRKTQITPYSLKRTDSVVSYFGTDLLRTRFPSHSYRGPARMVNGIVEQFGKRIPADVEGLLRGTSDGSLCLETFPNGVLL